MPEFKPNIYNEQVVLAQMIHSVDFRKRIVVEIDSGYFLVIKHKLIFTVLQRITEKSLDYNEDTFIVEANDMQNSLELLTYLKEILKVYDSNQNLDYHLDVLKTDYHRKKVLVDKLPDIETKIFNGSIDLAAISDEFDSMSSDLKSGIDSGKAVLTGGEIEFAYTALLSDRRSREFKGFYFTELDEKLTCGVEPGLITTVAGLSGSGKTTLMSNFVSRLVHHNVSTLFFPQEEGGLRVFDRLVALVSGVETNRIKKFTKQLNVQEKIKMMSAIKQLSGLPLHIYDKPYLDWRMMRLYVEKYKPQVIVIDLFEKIVEIRGSLKQEVIAAQLDVLQNFVKEMNVHAIITAQLRRDLMVRKNKRPTLDAIKNSGKYHEASDLVIGLHREKYFDSGSTAEDIIELSVLKQRDGPAPFVCGYEFDGKHSRIGDYRIVDLGSD
jgi:replicative DNA helicase